MKIPERVYQKMLTELSEHPDEDNCTDSQERKSTFSIATMTEATEFPNAIQIYNIQEEKKRPVLRSIKPVLKKTVTFATEFSESVFKSIKGFNISKVSKIDGRPSTIFDGVKKTLTSEVNEPEFTSKEQLKSWGVLFILLLVNISNFF